MKLQRVLIATIASILTTATALAADANIRVNQAGYLPRDEKVGIAFSRDPLSGDFEIREAVSKRVVFRAPISKASSAPVWGGQFPHYYNLNFSALRTTGRFYIQIREDRSMDFSIGEYPAFQEDLLFFMRQQRCGYNPFLDMVCHRRDGRAFYAPFPDGTFVDASGGWHDAGDQLKYLITASNATARMMLAYELERAKFIDDTD